jgi:hypothetical protein
VTTDDDQQRQADQVAVIMAEWMADRHISKPTYLALRPEDVPPILDAIKQADMGAANHFVGMSRLIRLADLFPDEAIDVDAETTAIYVEQINPLAEYAINWAEFWHREHTEEWLCEPLFAAGRAHSIYAGAKTGKSWTVLAACAAMATGRAFLSMPASGPVHVLYVDFEMTEEDIRDRLEQFGYGHNDDLTHLHYIVLPSLPPLDTEAGGIALLLAARAYQAVFVVIDTIGRAVQGTENDADTIQAFYRHTGKPLKRDGIGWVRLAHSGKDSDRGQRGSSAANDDVDIVIKLTRTDDGQKLTTTHRRMSWFPEVSEVTISENGSGIMTFGMAGGHSWPAGTASLAAELDRLNVPTGIGRPKIREGWPNLVATNDVLAAAIKYRKSGQRVELAMPSETLPEKAERLRNGVGQVAGQADVNRNSDRSSDSSKNPYHTRPDSSSDSSDSSNSRWPDRSVSLSTDSPADQPDDDDIGPF